MSTDFTYGGKQIITGGPIKPSGKDMPSDARTRVESYADIASIPNPHVGLKITVKVDETNDNEMTDYIVKSLKANSMGSANSAIDEVVRYVDYLGVSAGGGSGEGLTSTQKQQLKTAYEHSQSPHVTSNDLLSIDAASLNGKKISGPMTKEEYDAIPDKDPNTIYLVNDDADNAVEGIPSYGSAEANKVLAVNSDGTALAWVDAPSGSISLSIVDNVDSNSKTSGLSANQGNILSSLTNKNHFNYKIENNKLAGNGTDLEKFRKASRDNDLLEIQRKNKIINTFKVLSEEEFEDKFDKYRWCSKNGKLSVVDGTIVNQFGNPFQLTGMCTFHIGIGHQTYMYEGLRTTKLYGANFVRAVLYLENSWGGGQGYLENREATLKKYFEIVDSAIKLDMYVLIDWHLVTNGNPQFYKEEAKYFFEEVSKKYSGIPNILYEICNEPNNGPTDADNVTWDNDIKPYAEEIIPIIRNNDKEAIIIVGCENYSSRLQPCIDNPITGYKNIMYTYHIYVRAHNPQETLVPFVQQKFPVFVTEWGASGATGNDEYDLKLSQQFIDICRQYNLSWAYWTLYGRDTCFVLKPENTKYGGWVKEDLTEPGKLIFNSFENLNDDYSKIRITSLKLDKPSVSLKLGEKTRLQPIIEPTNASYEKLKWTASNPNVSVVSGHIITNGVGTAMITCSDSYGHSASCNVTITNNETLPLNYTYGYLDDAGNLSYDKNQLSVFENYFKRASKTVTLTSTFPVKSFRVNEYDSNKKFIKRSYSQTGSTITTDTFTLSSNCMYIRVGATLEQLIKLTADRFFREYKMSAGKVEEVPTTSISLNPTSLTFTSSTPQTITATVLPSNTTDSIAWSSDTDSIATVSDGIVTPKSNGSCVIKATSGSYSATCDVTVNISGGDEPSGGFDRSYEAGYYNDSGVLTQASGNFTFVNYYPLAEGTTTLTIGYGHGEKGAVPNSVRVAEYNSDKTFVKRSYQQVDGELTGTKSFTLDSNTKFVKIGFAISTSEKWYTDDLFNNCTIEES